MEPSYTAYQLAKEVSIKAYDDFKPIQNSMDFPELHYSKEGIPAMWEVYNKKKEYSDSCSKRTKELLKIGGKTLYRKSEIEKVLNPGH